MMHVYDVLDPEEQELARDRETETMRESEDITEKMKDRRRRQEDSEIYIAIEDIFEEEQDIAGGVLNDQPNWTARGKHIDNMTYSTVARDRENETTRESEYITELEVIYEQPEQTTGREPVAMNVNQAYSTVTDRRCKEDDAERESGDIQVEGLQLGTVEMTRNPAGGDQIAMNVNQAYSTVTDRRCKEDDAERESGDIQVEGLQLGTVEMTRNPAGGDQIAMNVNQAYSTVARDRWCKEDETERESGDMPNETLRLETDETIQNPAGGEIAMNLNQAYSTVVRERRCKEDEAERESRDMPNERFRLETDEIIRNPAGGDQIAMNDNMAYSTVARDKRQRECGAEAEIESGNIPEEGLRLEPVELIHDKPEQLSTDEELFDNMEQAEVICDQLQNEEVLEKTASAERHDWCGSMESGKAMTREKPEHVGNDGMTK